MHSKRFWLVTIIILALALRLVGLNWDQGYGLHPDERMIVMVTGRINWENLNPEFFNYGNLPVYLLKGISSSLGFLFGSHLIEYSSLLLIGRILSALFDTGTVFLIFLIGRRAWGAVVGLVGAFLYATAVFPIQNAHFYTVDTMLTFWLTLTLWLTIKCSDKLSLKQVSLIGGVVGLAAATKITGILALFLPLAVIAKNSKRFKFVISSITVLFFAATTIFFLTQPYVAIEFTEFWQQISLQAKMARDATIFPYTLQFIDTTAYLTPLVDIVRWGLGYPLGLLSLVGFGITVYWLYQAVSKPPRNVHWRYVPGFSEGLDWLKILVLAFFLFYFLILGRSAVKFMRYFLPLYPMLAIFAAVALDWFYRKFISVSFVTRCLLFAALLASTLAWPAAFMQIYLEPNSRIAATEWLNTNLPRGSTIAIEHWDDQVPLTNANNFRFEILEVYQPETQAKWNQINRQLDRSDYLIISSNRVYRAIMNWPEKYPTTTEFYRQLFANQTPFKLVNTFTSYPTLTLGSPNWAFLDANAPISFTIYDHPQVLVFESDVK